MITATSDVCLRSLKTNSRKGVCFIPRGQLKLCPYCPRCGTALSSTRLFSGGVSGCDRALCRQFLSVRMKMLPISPGRQPPGRCLPMFACASTRMWNAKAKKEGKAYILAKDLVTQVLGGDAEIVQTYRGSELVGRSYEPLFACTKKRLARAMAKPTISLQMTMSRRRTAQALCIMHRPLARMTPVSAESMAFPLSSLWMTRGRCAAEPPGMACL